VIFRLGDMLGRGVDPCLSLNAAASETALERFPCLSGCKLVRNRQGAVMAKPVPRIVKHIGPAACVAACIFSGHKSNPIA
jgi:hypothetical protein